MLPHRPDHLVFALCLQSAKIDCYFFRFYSFRLHTIIGRNRILAGEAQTVTHADAHDGPAFKIGQHFYHIHIRLDSLYDCGLGIRLGKLLIVFLCSLQTQVRKKPLLSCWKGRSGTFVVYSLCAASVANCGPPVLVRAATLLFSYSEARLAYYTTTFVTHHPIHPDTAHTSRRAQRNLLPFETAQPDVSCGFRPGSCGHATNNTSHEGQK